MKTSSQTPDPYAEFAAIYDKWQALHPQPFSLAMTLRMYQALEEFGVPEDSLLDIACGSGTLAHWWADRHPSWRIVGVDPSESMIEKAESRSGEAISPKRALVERSGPDPRFVHARPARLDLDEHFGMATCFFDSLNHITTREELLSTLRGIRRHLVENGLFMFDLIDEDSFEETFSSPWIIQSDSLFVGTESEFFERRGAEYGRVIFTSFEKTEASEAESDKGSSSWRRRQFTILERCWRREEFDVLLEEAGLENIHVQLIDLEDQPDVFVPRRLYVCRPAP